MNLAEGIAKAVNGIFRQQKSLALGGKERFHDWDSRLAKALLAPMAAAFLAGLKSSKAFDSEWAASAARNQASDAAYWINDGTASMVQELRDPRDVLSSDRAALIGLDQANRIAEQCKAQGARERGKKLMWVTDGKACDFCKKLNGRVRKPGVAFLEHNGKSIMGPPGHMNCKCRTREV